MKQVVWLLAIAAAAGLAFWFRSWRGRQVERRRASEERFASFMAQAMVAAKPSASPASNPAERLLFEAAGKAGEAGEPVLSIQLYARLLARYPECAFVSQARAAVEEQKKKLSKA